MDRLTPPLMRRFTVQLIALALFLAFGVFVLPHTGNAARTDGLWQERLSTYVELIWPEGRNVLLRGTNKYLNFGVVSGTTGYGIRDNGGTIECKNSGGSWGPCQDGSASLSGGAAGLLAAWTDATTLTATSAPTVGYVTATGTEAVSSFAGKLMIGTTTAANAVPFAIDNGTGGGGIDIYSGNAAYRSIVYNTLFGELLLGPITNQGIRFQTNNTDRVTISAAGVLSASYGSKLSYAQGTNGPLNTYPSYLTSTGTALTVYGADGSAFVERARVLNNGNVGIGTSSPYAKLSVNGETVASRFTATTTTASRLPYASSTAITATTFYGALAGNALTATALGANGADCSAGSAPLGVDASGAVESCFDVWTEAENTSAGYQTAANVYSIVGATTTLANLTITASQVSDFNAAANAYIHASTTIPKTYTANTYTGLQTFATARATAVGIGKAASASIRLDILTDGTYTQGARVEGDANTRLGFSGFVTGDAQVRYTQRVDGFMGWGDGTNVTDTSLYRSAANTLKTDDAFVADNITTSSTTGTSTFPLLSVTGAVSILGEYFTNFTTYVRSLFTGGNGITITAGSIAVNAQYTTGKLGFTYASSTQGAATTTRYLGPAPYNLTLTTAQCDFSNWMHVSVYDGTNRSNLIFASSTVGTTTFAVNQTFTQGEPIRVDVGTSSNPASAISGGCTIKYTY